MAFVSDIVVSNPIGTVRTIVVGMCVATLLKARKLEIIDPQTGGGPVIETGLWSPIRVSHLAPRRYLIVFSVLHFFDELRLVSTGCKDFSQGSRTPVISFLVSMSRLCRAADLEWYFIFFLTDFLFGYARWSYGAGVVVF